MPSRERLLWSLGRFLARLCGLRWQIQRAVNRLFDGVPEPSRRHNRWSRWETFTLEYVTPHLVTGEPEPGFGLTKIRMAKFGCMCAHAFAPKGYTPAIEAGMQQGEVPPYP